MMDLEATTRNSLKAASRYSRTSKFEAAKFPMSLEDWARKHLLKAGACLPKRVSAVYLAIEYKI